MKRRLRIERMFDTIPGPTRWSQEVTLIAPRSSIMTGPQIRQVQTQEVQSRVDLTSLALQPGRVTELTGHTGFGLTRLGLGLLATPSRRSPVVALDVKGWLSPLAAWEVGIAPARLVVVRCRDLGLWAQMTAVLMEGMRAIYAEVPATVRDHDLRRLAALARARKVGVVFRPLGEGLSPGIAHLRLRAVEVRWEGAVSGHGRLQRRHLVVEASGKAMAGMTRRIEMVDDGADIMRVVSGLGVGSERSAVG